MSSGIALFLIAVGAILRYAVTATVAGIDIQTVGTILIVIGLVGLVMSIVWLIMNRNDPGRRPPGPPPGGPPTSRPPY